MGGWGSGRRWSGKDTTDDYRTLDIRKLDRKRWLGEGQSSVLRWKKATGEETGSIGILAEKDRLILNYRNRPRGEQWETLEYPVLLDFTPCHFGGTRVWFLCPGRRCGRRVAVLYLSRYFVCRYCLQLGYQSQREGSLDRALERAQSVHARLKGLGGVIEGLPPRPKGMHMRTYGRLAKRFHLLEAKLLLEEIARFGTVVRL